MTKLSLAARRQKALEHALAGKTARQIGELLDVSHTTAHNYVRAALRAYAKRNEKQIIEHRELIGERYMRLWQKWQRAAEEDPESKAGDKLLRIMEGLRALYGLDRPVEKPDDRGDGGLTTVVINTKYVPGTDD